MRAGLVLKINNTQNELFNHNTTLISPFPGKIFSIPNGVQKSRISSTSLRNFKSTCPLSSSLFSPTLKNLTKNIQSPPITFSSYKSFSDSREDITMEGDELRDLNSYEMARCLLGMRISGTLATFSSSFSKELVKLDEHIDSLSKPPTNNINDPNTSNEANNNENKKNSNNQNSKVQQIDEQDQQPIWGCIMPYVLKGSTPILSIHPEEVHSTNIQSNNNASLTVYALTPKYITPQSVPLQRLVLYGTLEKFTDPANIQLAKLLYREAHPGSVGYLEDYDYYCLKSNQIHYYHEGVKLSFLDVTKFRETEVDIMTGDARKLIEILNFKNKDDVLKMCQHYANVDTDEAFIFHIDRFGFNVAAKKTNFVLNEEGSKAKTEWSQIRFPFPYRMHTIEELVEALLQAFQNCKMESGNK